MENEKRLIDAIEKEKPYIPTSDYEVGYNNGLVMAQSIALKLDAVPVVRCKDCRHCKPDENIIGAYGDCDRFDRYNSNSIVQADDFCSYGEREGE